MILACERLGTTNGCAPDASIVVMRERAGPDVKRECVCVYVC